MGAATMTTIEVFALGFITGVIVGVILFLGLIAMTND
jgi:hypothetical protein